MQQLDKIQQDERARLKRRLWQARQDVIRDGMSSVQELVTIIIARQGGIYGLSKN